MDLEPDRGRDLDAAPELAEADIARIFRENSGRSVAALIRVFGDIDVAEDAVQEAFTVALRRRTGLPQPRWPRIALKLTSSRRPEIGVALFVSREHQLDPQLRRRHVDR